MARLLMIVTSAHSIDLASEKGYETGYAADEVLKPYDKGDRYPRRKDTAC